MGVGQGPIPGELTRAHLTAISVSRCNLRGHGLMPSEPEPSAECGGSPTDCECKADCIQQRHVALYVTLLDSVYRWMWRYAALLDVALCGIMGAAVAQEVRSCLATGRLLVRSPGSPS